MTALPPLADQLFAKAERSLRSARTLLADGDPDGACNRCYYAMFDAARAALIACGALSPAGGRKTHSAVIAAFGAELVKSGRVESVLGRQLNAMEERRLVVDYTGDSFQGEDVAAMLSEAEAFVTTVRSAVCVEPGAPLQP